MEEGRGEKRVVLQNRRDIWWQMLQNPGDCADAVTRLCCSGSKVEWNGFCCELKENEVNGKQKDLGF